MKIEELPKEINGWQIYRNSKNGEIVAYHRCGSDPEQLIFETYESFERWLEAERNE